MSKLMLRKITSLVGLWSMIIMAWSGIMLYFVPPGRIAYWVGWQFAGLSKTQYGQLHQTFAILLMVSMILHIWLNWKSIMLYWKNREKKFVFFTKEMVIASLLSFAFFFGTLYLWAPFSTFIYAVEEFKDDYEYVYGNPPFGHAEIVPLNNFCLKMGLDLPTAVKQLNSEGLTVSSEKLPLSKLAKENGTTPAGIYEIIKDAKKKKPTDSKGDSNEDEPQITGLGRMKFERLAEKAGVSMDVALKRLAAEGINVEATDKVKTVAEAEGVMPIDMYYMIKGEKK